MVLAIMLSYLSISVGCSGFILGKLCLCHMRTIQFDSSVAEAIEFFLKCAEVMICASLKHDSLLRQIGHLNFTISK